MRLAFIKKRFSIHGGAERYLQTLIRQLMDAGQEIHVFANQWSVEEGIIFHRVNIIPITSFLGALTFNMNVRSRLSAKSSRFYDCIISFERTTCQDIYRAGDGCHAEWLRIRSQFEPLYKMVSFRINPFHIVLLNLEKRIFNETRLIIVNSRMVKRQILEHYQIPEDKIRIIYNGVDLERFNPKNRDIWRHTIRAGLSISEDSIVLLFVGSGFERKGLSTLIKALRFTNKNIKVLIIGKGSYERYMELAKDLGVKDRLIPLGIQHEVEKFYAASDIFVLPTLYDPFSNASLEAMASGIPVITTKNNGMAEIIEDGREGFVTNNLSDPEELADKITLCISNHDPMGKAARQRAEEYSIKGVTEEFIKTINSHVKTEKQ